MHMTDKSATGGAELVVKLLRLCRDKDERILTVGTRMRSKIMNERSCKH